eukprot:TRINITY_DN7236_c0_g1_i1.p1 TRINITY_DN7236_c0_g1~~TRINITY_DN7236_c0_g1_i1.p1  ORF type:complete len:335 (-),score=17.76 TRINITY_DN7236_c0_g1_i1:228-1232(-)
MSGKYSFRPERSAQEIGFFFWDGHLKDNVVPEPAESEFTCVAPNGTIYNVSPSGAIRRVRKDSNGNFRLMSAPKIKCYDYSAMALKHPQGLVAESDATLRVLTHRGIFHIRGDKHHVDEDCAGNEIDRRYYCGLHVGASRDHLFWPGENKITCAIGDNLVELGLRSVGISNIPCIAVDWPRSMPSSRVKLPDYTLYILDHHSCTIRMAKNGRVSWFAGSGVYGYLDGPVQHARFKQLRCIAIHNDVLYILDGSQLRMIKQGRVSTLVRKCDPKIQARWISVHPDGSLVISTYTEFIQVYKVDDLESVEFASFEPCIGGSVRFNMPHIDPQSWDL